MVSNTHAFIVSSIPPAPAVLLLQQPEQCFLMAPILKNAPFENAFPVYAVTLVFHSSSSTPRCLCLFHDFELCVFLVLLWQAEHCALHHLTRYLECHMWPDSVKLKDSACFSVTIYPDKLERKRKYCFALFSVLLLWYTRLTLTCLNISLCLEKVW